MADKNTKLIAAATVVIIVIAVIAVAVVVLGNDRSATSTNGKSGVSATTSPSSTPQPVTITISGYWGVDGLTTYDPALLAEHLGYLKEPYNISIVDSDVQVGAPGLAAISAGQIQAAHVQYNTLIRAAAAGGKYKAVVTAHGAQSTVNWHLFTLNSSGIKSAADLKGKKIGEVIPGDTSYIAMEEYLKTANLTINDVNLVSIPFGQEDEALRAGTVDATGVWLDFTIANMQDEGGVTTLTTIYDTLPANDSHCGIVFSDDYINAHPDVVKEFVTGVVKANEWAQANPDQARQFYKDLATERGKNASLIDKYYIPTDIRAHSLIDENPDLTYYNNWLINDGDIKPGQVNLSDLYTNEFNPYYNQSSS